MDFRDATPADAELVARLHIESWRSAYAHILDPTWLAGPIEAERTTAWARRFDAPDPSMRVIIAEEDGHAIGFAGVFLDADPLWGTLVDNLHVRPAMKGKGLGRALLARAAAWAVETARHPGLHLWVFEANRAARGFYERMGGEAVERADLPNADGTVSTDLRYAWRDAAQLARAASSAGLT